MNNASPIRSDVLTGDELSILRAKADALRFLKRDYADGPCWCYVRSRQPDKHEEGCKRAQAAMKGEG